MSDAAQSDESASTPGRSGVAAAAGAATGGVAEAALPRNTKELTELLRQRDEDEAKRLLEQVKAGLKADEPCPVCTAPLDAKPAPPLLGALLERTALGCSRCDFVSPPLPNPVGRWLVTPLVTALCVYAGMQVIFAAQRLTADEGQLRTFVIGFALFGLGMFTWNTGMGSADPKPRRQRILEKRRRREEKEAGIRYPSTAPGFGESLETIVVTVILALILRHFITETFVIPTGSMAPTLLGDHYTVTCERCRHSFPIGKREPELASGPVRATATCPLCDLVFESERGQRDVTSGDMILVNKFLWRLRPPKRYEVIVFKFPKTPWNTYIKRLIGLPGEAISIRNGDVFADGKRARKPDHVQDGIWIPVHDAAYGRQSGDPRWAPSQEVPGVSWTFGREGASQPDLDGQRVAFDPKGNTGLNWLDYRGRKLHTSYGYNRRNGPSGPITADLRVRARVTGQDKAVAHLAIKEHVRSYDESTQRSNDVRHLVSARFTFGQGQASFAIEYDGAVVAEVTRPALRPGKPYELALAYADDRARLQVDGETLVAWDDDHAVAWDDPQNSDWPTQGVLPRFGAANAPVVFEHLRIDRDVHYVTSSAGEFDPTSQVVEIPARSYFVMGDNSPNSEDGRSWGFVREGHVIGRAVSTFFPLDLSEPYFGLHLIR